MIQIDEGESGDTQQNETGEDPGQDQQPGLLDAGDDCQETVEELESALFAATEQISGLEKQLAEVSRSYELERHLVESGVVDLETATVLAERRLQGSEATVEEVVADLVSSKGFLFRSKSKKVIAGSAVSGGPVSAKDSIQDLADEARQSGDRRAVLRYLRRRRG